MFSTRQLLWFISCTLLCVASAQSSQARGWSYSPPPKEVRQPGLWYGDKFVAEDVKTATYSNYHQVGSGVNGVVQQAEGQSPAQQFSGPDHITPDQYHYFVQVYHW